MKYLLTINFLLLFNQNIDFGIYQYDKFGSKYTLYIGKDFTFVYNYPSVHLGRITEMGSWEIEEDFLILKDSVGIVYDKSNFANKIVKQQNFVTITLKDENNNKLSGFEVALNEDNYYKQSDANGKVTFEYSEIKKRRFNQPDNSVEIVTIKSEKWNEALTVKNIFGNNITIVKDFNPEKVFHSRTRRLTLIGESIFFINPSGEDDTEVFEFKKKKK